MFQCQLNVVFMFINFVLFVHFQSWDAYFRNNTYCAPPSLAPNQPHHIPISQLTPLLGGGNAISSVQPDEKTIDDHLAVQAIIRSYQVMPFRANFVHIVRVIHILSFQKSKIVHTQTHIYMYK